MSARLIGLATLTLTIAAALWVGLDGARATWHSAGYVQGQSVPVRTVRAKAPEAPPDLAPILTRHLFGAPVALEAPISVAPEQTALDLVLHGVVLAGDRERSIAYISAAGKPAEGFAPGDRVAERAVVTAIREAEVLLEVDGRAEILGFPEQGTRAGANRVRANILAATNQGGLPANGSTPDQAIEFWRQRIAANPQAVLDQLGLEATDKGYVVGERSHAGVRRAGFRPGDVVARVNGTAVGDVEADRRLYDEIAASGRARVELIRNGSPIILTFPLR